MSSSTENGSPQWSEILKSANRIMNSHSLHFYTLSILFLLPIFFTLLVYPSFHLALFHPQYDFNTSTQLQFSTFEIIVPTVYTLLLALFFICAIATITYRAVQVFHDNPINLFSSVKSIRNSFFPLLSTFIISHTIFISVILVSTLVFDLINHLCFLFILVIVLVWLQVNWSLAYVIAVVESKCGFETLRRSAYLVKGKRYAALSMIMFYGLLMGMLVVVGSMWLVVMDAAKGNRWRSLGVIVLTVEFSVTGFVLMNQYLVWNVAFYMYCNGFNGHKLPLEIRDKFARASEYVSVPLDDEKKNHAIVWKAYASTSLQRAHIQQ